MVMLLCMCIITGKAPSFQSESLMPVFFYETHHLLEAESSIPFHKLELQHALFQYINS